MRIFVAKGNLGARENHLGLLDIDNILTYRSSWKTYVAGMVSQVPHRPYAGNIYNKHSKVLDPKVTSVGQF